MEKGRRLLGVVQAVLPPSIQSLPAPAYDKG